MELRLCVRICLAIFLPVVSSVCNSETEFDCGAQCVPLEWRCDNVPDCTNTRDEVTCNYLYDCPHGYMTCRDGECVKADLKCDGRRDCMDGSDERACPTPRTPLASKAKKTLPLKTGRDICQIIGYFRCNSGLCISLGALCDGVPDCEEDEDETECPFKCRRNWKQCASGMECMPKEFFCDGKEDCEDGSDEHESRCKSDATVSTVLQVLIPTVILLVGLS